MATFHRRGGTLNEVSHRNLQTMKRVEQTPKAKPWYIKLDKSNIPVYVDTLSSRLKRENIDTKKIAQRVPFKIDSTLFKTADNYPFHHMPKIEDVYYKRLNFSFGENRDEQNANLEDMLTSPKSLVLYYRQKSKKNKEEFLTLRAYFIASKLNNENLPQIYRIDIRAKEQEGNFSLDHIKGSAVVGGCVDGECPLFEIGGDERGIRLYSHRSGKTSYDINWDDEVSNLFYEVKELDVKDLYEASKFAFEYFNVQDVLVNSPYDNKLLPALKVLNVPNKSDCTVPISGDKFIGLTIGKDNCFETEKSWQYVYNMKGKQNKTNIPKATNDVPEF